MCLKICMQYKSENILLFMQLPELSYWSSRALTSDKVYTKHLNMVRRREWTAAQPWENMGQMRCTWLSSDWKCLLSRQQRTMYLAACPSRGATVSCQGNSCFHPPKGEITHSLHSRNSFFFPTGFCLWKPKATESADYYCLICNFHYHLYPTCSFLEEHTKHFVSETSI